jgi:hypothetical protein
MANRKASVARRPSYAPPDGLEDQIWRLKALAMQVRDFMDSDAIRFDGPDPEASAHMHMYQMMADALDREIAATADIVWPGYSKYLTETSAARPTPKVA